MGGASENSKFDNIYTETIDYYKAAFGVGPCYGLWETPQERFSYEVLSWVNLNLYRVANYYMYE